MKNTETIKPRNQAKSLSESEWIAAINEVIPQDKDIIKSNDKLAKSGIIQWSIPAYTASVVRKGKLQIMKTCPMAGLCAKACYACQGGYNFKSSMIAHSRNLQAWFNDPADLANKVIANIKRKRKINAIRIHDSGDFFNMSYAKWWLKIIELFPQHQFYAYTKQVSMFKGLAAKGLIPSNMSIIYSYGGKEDDKIDPSVDRHSKVFASHDEMNQAGYSDTTDTDDNAADPSINNIGLVYHGKVSVDTALGSRAVL